MDGYVKSERVTAIFEIFPLAIAALKKKLIVPIFGEVRQPGQYLKRPGVSELSGGEQLKKITNCISSRQDLPLSTVNQLRNRLAENEKILLEIQTVLGASSNNLGNLPRVQWLLNNFYLVMEQINIDKKFFPKTFCNGLPRFTKNRQAELIRLYEVSVEIISQCSGHIDLNNLGRLAIAYQSLTFLKIGKIWVFPIMLRLSLIENICRLSLQSVIDINHENQVAGWATQLIEAAIMGESKELKHLLGDMTKLEQPFPDSFLASLAQSLHEKGRRVPLVDNWLTQQVAEKGLTIEELVRMGNKKQSANLLSINCHINSLLFLWNIDWNEFVDTNCLKEQVQMRNKKRNISSNPAFFQQTYSPKWKNKTNNL